MIDNQLSTADIEQILLNIRLHEQHIATEQARFNETAAFYQQFIDKAKVNFDEATADDRAEIELLKARLQRDFDANPPTGRKSRKYAGGSFGYKKNSTKFFFNGVEVDANNKGLTRFCADNGYSQFIKVKEYLDWAGLKKNLDFDTPDTVTIATTGEVVDGLRAQKVFSVQTS